MIENLRHVRSFLEVARVGSFTRAAKALHVSQSALTVQIQQLESDLGAKLFNRGKRNTTLTQAGQDLLLPLHSIVLEADRIVRLPRELSELQRGVVSMAVLPSIASRIAPFAAQRFRMLYPSVEIHILDVVGDKLINAVRQGDVDFGVGKRSRPARDLTCTPLLVDRMVAFTHHTHPFAARESISLREVIASPLILLGRDSTVWDLVNQSLTAAALPSTFAYETNYISTAFGLVEADMGVAILPEMGAGAKISPLIRRIPIVDPQLFRHIDVIQKSHIELSPAATKMVQIVREIAGEEFGSSVAEIP